MKDNLQSIICYTLRNAYNDYSVGFAFVPSKIETSTTFGFWFTPHVAIPHKKPDQILMILFAQLNSGHNDKYILTNDIQQLTMGV